METRGVNIKIKRGNRLKWLHVSRCKLSESGKSTVATGVTRQATIAGGEENVSAEFSQAESDTADPELLGDATDPENEEEVEQFPILQNINPSSQRRYPLRNRIPKKYEDYILEPWQDPDPDHF